MNKHHVTFSLHMSNLLQALTSIRSVITGLEGCGKSSQVFQLLNQKATTEHLILFAFKNYKLMKHQIDSWSQRFDIPLSEFVICGNNEILLTPEYKNYTSNINTHIIPATARFVFISQALLQKNKYNELTPERSNAVVKHIVVDEFEFTSGIIPTFDYIVNECGISELTDNYLKQLEKWIKYNYTYRDWGNVYLARNYHQSGFTLAYWIEYAKQQNIPLTFLTSESLAVEFLELIGFTKHITDNKDWKNNCTINIWADDCITTHFFSRMNQEMIWNKLEYDTVISDSILNYFEIIDNPDATSLEISVIPHVTVQGRNDLMQHKILTVLSHIPNATIKKIHDIFLFYGSARTYDEIESMFYQCRLLQAVGRVLGYRGSNETDVICHTRLLELLNETTLPYQLNKNWIFEFPNKEQILTAINEDKRKAKHGKETLYKKKAHQQLALSYDLLNKYFELDADSVLTNEEIKQHCEQLGITNITCTNVIQVSKVAKYFGLSTTTMRIAGKVHGVIKGLRIK